MQSARVCFNMRVVLRLVGTLACVCVNVRFRGCLELSRCMRWCLTWVLFLRVSPFDPWCYYSKAYEKKLKQEAAKAAAAAAAAQQQQQQAWGTSAAAAGPKKSLAEIQVCILGTYLHRVCAACSRIRIFVFYTHWSRVVVLQWRRWRVICMQSVQPVLADSNHREICFPRPLHAGLKSRRWSVICIESSVFWAPLLSFMVLHFMVH